MFDILQISWWFFQVTLVGYFFNQWFLEDDTDRLLFAAPIGLAATIVVSSIVWFWSIPIYVNSVVIAASLGAGLVMITRRYPKPSRSSLFFLAGGVLLVAIQGSFIPFSEKLWQGYPLDRFGFLSTHILFQQENFKYFADALARISFNGEKQVFILHPMITAAFGEMQSRPAAGLVFGALAWMTPHDLHRLGNAWEVFLRAVQFASIFALFFKGLKSKFWAGFLSIGTIFGYWFQYMKDYNSWPHMVTLALVIALVALMVSILGKGEVSYKERLLVYLISLAMIINHAEFGIVLCLGLGIVIGLTPVLRKGFLYRRVFIAESFGFIGLVLLAHPYIISWTTRMFIQSPGMVGGESAQARGIYSLFGSDNELYQFVSKIGESPIYLISDPVALSDMLIGSTGFAFVTYIGSSLTIIGTLVIILCIGVAGVFKQAKESGNSYQWSDRPAILSFAACVGLVLMAVLTFCPNSVDPHSINIGASLLLGSLLFALIIYGTISSKTPGLRILLILSCFHLTFFIVCLFAKHFFGVLGAGAAYRSLGYWGAFASMALTLQLASTEQGIFRAIAGCFSVFNLIFGLSIFWVANYGGMETYPKFYPNSTGVRHFEKETVRDKYDFDYLSLVESLSTCNLVFLDFKEVEPRGIGRFHAANLMMFLDNNRIRYRLGFPYLNGYNLLGGSYYPGFKKEELGVDCTVDQELRNGRISYRLTKNEWR